MERLVDWTDQAVLILRIEDPDHQPATDDRLSALRGLGIRTASDLVRTTTSDAPHLRAAVKTALQMDDKQLKGLIDLLENEPVMRNIRCWQTSELGHPDGPVPRILLPRAPSTPPVAVSHNSERTPLSFA